MTTIAACLTVAERDAMRKAAREGADSVSPWAPRQACSVCRRTGCKNPEHKRQPWQRGERQLARPERNTSAERKRRAAVVAAFLAEHGMKTASGDTIARCPECHAMRAKWVADHVHPIALGGTEDGPLRYHCSSCSARQGARIANRRRPPGRPVG